MNKLDFFVLNSEGRFVTVEFIKKDGTLRKLTGRLGVKKHLKGGKSTLNPEQYITIYDVQNAGYRAINRATITALTIEGMRMEVTA